MKSLFCVLISIFLLFACACGFGSSLNAVNTVPNEPAYTIERTVEEQPTPLETPNISIAPVEVSNTKNDYFVMHDTPQSSCFSEVGYNPTTETLRVCFRTTGYYQYYNFSQEDYDSFISADSLGSYFNKCIKGYFPCEKE